MSVSEGPAIIRFKELVRSLCLCIQLAVVHAFSVFCLVCAGTTHWLINSFEGTWYFCYTGTRYFSVGEVNKDPEHAALENH